MKIKISGVYELKTLLPKLIPTHVVSIGEDTEWNDCGGAFNDYRGAFLRLRFSDIPGPIKNISLISPSIEHVKEAVEFAEQIGPDGRLLVHCHAGLSRSPAIMLGILAWRAIKLRSNAPDDALVQSLWDKTYALSPHAIPHEGIIKMADELMPEFSGALSRALAIRKSNELRMRKTNGGLIIPHDIW